MSKLMQCKTCGAELAPSAKTCPKCGAKNKKPIYKRPWFIILAVMIVIGLVSGGNDGPKSTGSVSNTDVKVSETSKQVKQEARTLFDQEEVVTFKGVEYAVTNVEKVTGREYETAADGKEYVIITLSIHNTSDEKISYNPFDWKMENSNGQVESQTFVLFDSDTSLSSGELKTGGKVEGTIIFEEPIGDEGLKLCYFENPFKDDESFQIQIH